MARWLGRGRGRYLLPDRDLPVRTVSRSAAAPVVPPAPAARPPDAGRPQPRRVQDPDKSQSTEPPGWHDDVGFLPAQW